MTEYQKSSLSFKKKNVCMYIYFGVSVAMHGLSLVAASGVSTLQLQWLLLLQSRALGHVGFSSCIHGLRVPVWLKHSAACGIFQSRDQICVPCIGGPILNHQNTTEVPELCFFFFFFFKSSMVKTEKVFQITSGTQHAIAPSPCILSSELN